MIARHPEVVAPTSVGAFLATAPFLAQAAGAGGAYGLCGAAAGAVGAGAVPFALETREAPTAVALSGVGAAAWGSWTAWACWSGEPVLSKLAIGAFLTLASGAAGAVIRWKREGTPIERAKLDMERARLGRAEGGRGDAATVAAGEPDAPMWAELPASRWEEPATVPAVTAPVDLGGGVVLPLVGGHVIIGGATGAGKSVIMANAIADLLPREHVRVSVVDPKGDVLLSMLRNSDVTLVGYDDAERFMAGHVETMKRRGAMVDAAADAYTRGVGPLPAKMWVPTAEEPWDAIFVDEFTDLAGTPFMDDLVEIARKSRALGQTLFIATQSLEAALFRTDKSSSGGGPRSQFSTRVAGRLDNASESEKVFGAKQADVWPAHLMPGKGHVLVRSEDQREPVMRRVPEMDMATLAAWARKCRTSGGDPGRSAADRESFEPPADTSGAVGSGRHLTVVKTAPATQAEKVLDYLTSHGSSSTGSIAGGTGVPRASLGKVLQRLAEDGCVVKADGLWKPL